MLPADGILKGAVRWLRLLQTSTVGQAMRIIRADSRYADLTQTQYASSLEWLESLRMLEFAESTLRLKAESSGLPEEQLFELLLLRALEYAAPAWLRDADVLIADKAELPRDALDLARALGISEDVVFRLIRRLQGHVDTKERERVGRAGEDALTSLLESCWPGSTTHVSLINDSFGYDILFRSDSFEWHLEVKTTTRRGRLVIHLSRNEHEVSLSDPCWRLIVAGIDDKSQLQAVANVPAASLMRRAPRDALPESRWDSVSHDLRVADLQAGLTFLPPLAPIPGVALAALIQTGGLRRNGYAWMP